MRQYSTEEIENYLEGNLTTSEQEAFEQDLSTNQQLQHEVETQKKIVATVALAGFQHAMVGAHDRFVNNTDTTSTTKGKSGWSFTQYFGLFAIASLGIFGLWRLTDSKPQIVEKEQTNTLVSNDKKQNKNRKLTVDFNTYTFLAEEGTTIKDPRSGAKITIKPNSLNYKSTGKPVKGEVNLSYREFRNQADIALSEISMDYKDKHFNSAGMFEIRSRQGEEALAVKDGEEISIDFRMTKNEEGTSFYALGDETQKWEKLHELPKSKEIYKPKHIKPLESKSSEDFNFEDFEFNDSSEDLEPIFLGLRSDNSPIIAPQISDIAKELVSSNASTLGLAETEYPNNSSAIGKSPEELFFNEKYTSPVGDAFNNVSKMKFKTKTFSDPIPTNIELVSQQVKKVKTKKSKGKKTKFESSQIAIPTWSNPISIVTKVDTVSIFDNSSTIFFKELEPLKGWIFYDKTNQIYRGNDIFDIRIDVDSTANNGFIIHLKHASGISSTPVSLFLGKTSRQIMQRHYQNYLTLRNARMQRIIRAANINKQKTERIKAIVKNADNRLDQLIAEKDDNIYALAKLTMTESELMMTKDEWFEKMGNDPVSIQKLKDNLQTIKEFTEDKLGASKQLVDLIRQSELRQTKLVFLKKLKKLATASRLAYNQPTNISYSDFSLIKPIMSKDELFMTLIDWKPIAVANKNSKSNRYLSFYQHIDSMTTGYEEFYWSIYQKHEKRMTKIRSSKKLNAELQKVNALNQENRQKESVDNGTTSAGHYKDPLVRKLAIKDFGVFNCDQVYRLAHAVQINAQYTCNGNALTNNRVLTVIDKKINGALSFDPKLPTVSTSSNTCLLLVTKDDRYYFYSSEDWDKSKPQQKGEHQFQMTEVTNDINEPKDLQSLIEGENS